MRATAKTVQFRRSSDRDFDRAARTVLAISGALFSLVGFLLAIGGYLSVQEGSAFYMLAGLGLIGSGVLVARRHRAGAWTYMLVFAGTVSWSLRNLDIGSSLALRLLGPSLLLVMIAILMPLLVGWRPRQTLSVLTVIIGVTVALAIASLPKGPLAHRTAAATQFLDSEAKGVLQ